MLYLLKKGIVRQYFFGFIASFCFATCSSSYVWINPEVDFLESSLSPVAVPNGHAFLLAFLPEVGGIISPILAGHLADVVGRRYLMIAAGIVQTISWAGASLADFNTFCVIRFTQGLVMGAVMAALPMYLSEIAETKSRGQIVVLYALGWNLGLFLEYLASPFTSFYALIWFNTAISGLSVLLLFVTPPSPYFRLMKGDRKGALQSLSRLRDQDGLDPAQELDQIQESLGKEEKGSWSSLKTCPVALEICFVLGACYYTAGSMSLILYSDSTFGKMISGSLSSRSFTLGMGAVMSLVPVVTLRLVDAWGRRPILLVCFTAAAVAIAPSVVFLSLPKSLQNAPLAYASVAGICLYVPLIALGPMSVLNLFRAELFPSSARASASGLLAFYNNLLSLVSIVVYRPLEVAGLNIINFAFYLGFMLLGALYSLFRIPETKGKSFEEIQATLRKTKNKVVSVKSECH